MDIGKLHTIRRYQFVIGESLIAVNEGIAALSQLGYVIGEWRTVLTSLDVLVIVVLMEHEDAANATTKATD